MFGPSHFAPFGNAFEHQGKVDKLDPMQNQLCRVCDEPAAGFHFGAFTCEGCKSFFGRTCNNQSVIQECKNNYRCVINKKNRTACKACRLRKCLMVGMSKSGSRYGRRSNWFKIHCLMQQAAGGPPPRPPAISPSSLTPPTLPDRPPSGPVSPTSLSTTSPPGLWRPLEAPSPKSVQSEPPVFPTSRQVPALPILPNAPPTTDPKRRSPSHSPLSSHSDKELNGAAALLLNQQLLKGHQHPVSNGQLKPPGLPQAALEAADRTPPPPAPQLPDFPLPTSSVAPRFPAMYPTMPFLPPTFNLPALASLPLHKQALLSPLLASSQMLAAAAVRGKTVAGGVGGGAPGPTAGYPFLAAHPLLAASEMAAAAAAAAAANAEQQESKTDAGDRRPSPSPVATPAETTPTSTTQAAGSAPSAPSAADILAEHRALLERFKSSMKKQQEVLEAAAAAAVAAAAASTNGGGAPIAPSAPLRLSPSPPTHNNNNDVSKREGASSKPMDLTKRPSEEMDDDDDSSVGSMGSQIIPRLSDTEPEEEDTAVEEDEDDEGDKAKKEATTSVAATVSTPLDLTCG